MSIAHYTDRLEVSLPVAKALLAFASRDATRPHLGVGFREGCLSATDGHVLLSFDADCRQWAEEPGLHAAMVDRIVDGKYWSTAHVDTALKVARATKSAAVRLNYADLAPGFPPCSQVIPSYGVELGEPFKFDPAYVGQLDLVCKACGDGGALLVSARAPLEPLMFSIGERTELRARVVLMPMRRDGVAPYGAKRARG